MGHDALRVSPGHLFQRVSCLCSVHSRVVIGQSLLDASSAVQATGIEQFVLKIADHLNDRCTPETELLAVLAASPCRLSCDAGRRGR